MKRIIIFLILISSHTFAQFDDNVIEPFLGPYELSKKIIGDCPKSLVLIAECSLDQLDLRNSDDLDFVFLSFKSINSGEAVTKIADQIVERSLTTFNNLELSSSHIKYPTGPQGWVKNEVFLKLGNTKLSLRRSKSHYRNLQTVKDLDCMYSKASKL